MSVANHVPALVSVAGSSGRRATPNPLDPFESRPWGNGHASALPPSASPWLVLACLNPMVCITSCVAMSPNNSVVANES